LIFHSISTSGRRVPNLLTSKVDKAVRGKIISKDNFHLASSYKVYEAYVDTRCIDKDKKDLFISLFSIYSGIDKKSIEDKINSRRGHITLSRKLTSTQANNIKKLSYKLRKLDVFKPIKVNNKLVLYTLDIIETSEKREFLYNEILSPVLGYIRKDRKTSSIYGVKGIEQFLNSELNSKERGILKGERDVISHMIFNNASIIKHRKDGHTIHLTVPLKLQRSIELILDKFKESLEAEEIIASIMDSRTGNILAIATSNRFNPNRIKQRDVDESRIDITALEREFEPGSIMKPITFSILFELGLLKIDESINNHNGRLKLGKYIITDSHTIHDLNTVSAITESSNVASALLVQRVDGKRLHNYLKKYGFENSTNLLGDKYEKSGSLKSVKEYSSGERIGSDNIYKATTSYGYGINVTFIQMLQAYNTINNNGLLLKPNIINYMVTGDNKIVHNKIQKPLRVIKEKNAKKVQYLLEKTIEDGTGKRAKVDGVIMGGKTGTAHISVKGKYQKEYISSFFGFANDSNSRYTIGVTTFRPKNESPTYFASHAAAPVFKEIVENLIRLEYLSKSNAPNMK
jgi:cell division protein FtsI (penicillin-binding protein 3)